MQFDRRVVPEGVLRFIGAVQGTVECHLAGGAGLSGVHLAHRLSGDIDLFVHDASAHRRLAASLPSIARSVGATLTLVRDAGGHVRANLVPESGSNVAVDLVHESVADIAPAPDCVEGVLVESLSDLRAAKLTCVLNRTEPRDLVDLYFLDQAGYPPEADLALALRKDAGIDPSVLAWLLAQFPLAPLPILLRPLDEGRLRAFRDELAQRFRRVSLP